MHRFTEYDFEYRNLAPIGGYWQCKLVSLEEALAPLVPHINELSRSIKESKRLCHYPSEHGLSCDESAAVYLYTMEADANSLYRVLNKTLRDEDRSKVKPWFAYLKLFDEAVSKLPTAKQCLWRGVPGNISKDYTKNEMQIWWNITSCSSSVDIVKSFLDPKKASTLIMIEAIKAKDLSGYTMYPSEKEFILIMGTKLRVKDQGFKHGDLHVVHLEEVDDIILSK